MDPLRRIHLLNNQAIPTPEEAEEIHASLRAEYGKGMPVSNMYAAFLRFCELDGMEPFPMDEFLRILQRESSAVVFDGMAYNYAKP